MFYFSTLVYGIAAVSLFMLPMASTAKAELAPGSYDKQRKEAAEVLVIEVTKVTPKVNGKVTDYTVEANVLKAEKSDTGLKKGAKITITYTAVAPPFAGPRQQVALVVGDVYPAFLVKEKDAKTYSLAAHGMSFSIASE